MSPPHFCLSCLGTRYLEMNYRLPAKQAQFHRKKSSLHCSRSMTLVERVNLSRIILRSPSLKLEKPSFPFLFRWTS